MATQDQTNNSTFTMANADVHNWQAPKTGYYRLRVGSGGSPNFNSQTVAVTQDGDALTDGTTALSALAAYTDKIVHLIGDEYVVFTPSGAVTSVPVMIIPDGS